MDSSSGLSLLHRAIIAPSHAQPCCTSPAPTPEPCTYAPAPCSAPRSSALCCAWPCFLHQLCSAPAPALCTRSPALCLPCWAPLPAMMPLHASHHRPLARLQPALHLAIITPSHAARTPLHRACTPAAAPCCASCTSVPNPAPCNLHATAMQKRQ
ncbi:hypothetical protein SLEP1_g46225 [Rubroshorea leprosula]|uniref:Uncharacterized protein n=1 Tax=Rubroshorea leprosula TaxID=152421 RepID=A0AAV5LLK0_9ROSI|nr:hypothetical protein SLEP1_g46225 [Rubroshorea leprosula]